MSLALLNRLRSSRQQRQRLAHRLRQNTQRRMIVESLESRNLMATFTWDGGGANTNWLTGANWVGDVAPAAGDDLVFTGSVKTTNVNNFAAGTTFNSITFDANAANFSISGSQITLNGGVDISVATGTQAITAPLAIASGSTLDTGSGSLSLGGVISGSGSLSKAGSGTLTLSGANTFSGGLTIKSGTAASQTSAAAFGTGTITIGDSTGSADATLSRGFSGTHTNAISVASGNSGLAKIAATATGSFSGAISLNSHDLSVTASGTANQALSGGVTGTGNVSLQAGSTSTITVSGTTWNHTGTISNSGTGAGDTTISAVIGANVTQVIQNSSTSSLTLSGANTFSGGLTVKAGTLTGSTNTGVFGTGTLTIGDTAGSENATLVRTVAGSMSNAIVAAGGNTGVATIRSSTGGTFSGSVSLSSHGLTIASSSSSTALTITGGISGTGDLTTSANGIGGITISTVGLNHSGQIINAGSGTGDLTISTTVGANVTGIVQNSTNSPRSVSGGLTVNSSGTTLTNTVGGLTVSGNISGTGNLTLANNHFNASGVNVAAVSVNNIGTITNSGSGASAVISAAVGSNVTGIIQNGASSLTVSGALAINSGGTSLTHSGGAGQLTVSGGVSGTGDLLLSNNSSTAAGIRLTTTAVNHTGKITNAGSGTGNVSVSSVVGTNVTGVVQDSSTSGMTLSGVNTFTTGVSVKAGTVSSATSAAAFGTGTITLGNSSGSADATLIRGFAGTHTNPIAVASGNTGIATISATTPGTFSGAITLNTHDLVLSADSSGGTSSITGGITGTGNLTIASMSSATVSLSGSAINPIGTITSAGTSTGDASISASIGSNVTNVIQSGAGSTLTLSGTNTFTGGLYVKAGTVSSPGTLASLSTATITIGDSSGSANATFERRLNGTVTNPIVIASGNTGVARIFSNASTTFGGTLTLNSHDVVLASSSIVTFSGNITGTGNVSLKSEGTGALTLSGTSVNNAGTITNLGTGTGSTVISAPVGSNVTAIVESSTTSALTISGAITVNSTGTRIANDLGTKVLTVSGGVSGTGNLVLQNNSATADAVLIQTGSINNTGTVTNSGSGSGSARINSVIGTNVTGVVQNGASTLTLAGVNTYTTGSTVNAGTLTVTGSGTFGATSGTLTVDGATAIANLNATSHTLGAINVRGGGSITNGTLTGTSYNLESGSVSAVLAGISGVTKTTSGTATLSAVNTYTGTTAVNGGTLLVDGSIANGPATTDVTVASGATLGGSGTISGNVSSSGIVAPGGSAGVLTAANITLASGSTFKPEIGGTTAGNTASNHDQLVATGSAAGSVTIASGVSLDVSAIGGFVPLHGSSFVIINNSSTGSVSGTFQGLAEGSTVVTPAGTFQISYVGGTGNDVVLTSVVDLQIQSLTASSGNLVVTYDFKTGSSSPFSIGLYRSPDGTTLGSLLTTTVVSSAGLLAAGTGHVVTLNTNFVDPQDDYFLVAVLDYNTTLTESNEGNNQAQFAGGTFLDANSILQIHRTSNDDRVTISESSGQLIAALTPAVTPPYWDVNGDGQSTSADTTSLSGMLTLIGTHPTYMNANNPYDVNQDGVVSSADVSAVTSYLSVGGTPTNKVDVTGDGVISPLDALLVINFLNGRNAGNLGANYENPWDINGDGTITSADQTALAGVMSSVQSSSVAISSVNGIHIRTHAGNDIVTVGSSIPTWVFGGSGNDAITTGTGADYVSGGAGDDLIHGGAGADTLLGDDDKDTLYGGTGDDTMSGGAGSDHLFGEAGDDTLTGDGDEDWLHGYEGTDTLTNDGVDHLTQDETLSGLSPTNPSNMLVNGSFEDYVITNPANWDVFATIPGWSLYGESISFELQKLVTAADGSQYIELDGDLHGPPGGSSSTFSSRTSTTIRQTVTTVSGGQYTLGFAFAARAGLDPTSPSSAATQNVLGLRIINAGDGQVLFDSSSIGNYKSGDTSFQRFLKSFAATGTETIIEFSNRGTPDSLGTFLDDVVLLPSVVSISDAVAVVEGGLSQFTVTLSTASDQTVSVEYATSGGTATSGDDFRAKTGTVTFSPGQTSKTISINTNADDEDGEGNEVFTVALSYSTNASIGTSSASGTILDDPSISMFAFCSDCAKAAISDYVMPTSNQSSVSAGPLTNTSFDYSKPILKGMVSFDSNAILADSIEVNATMNGVTTSSIYFDPATAITGTDYQIAVPFDASSFAEGKYTWSISVIEHHGATTVTHAIQGAEYVEPQYNGNFGSGWRLQGLDSLAISATGAYLKTSGGNRQWFKYDAFDGYHQDLGTTNELLLEAISGGYRITDGEGAIRSFNSAGLLTSSTDANGNETTYAYTDADSDSQVDDITTITDWVGRTTTFAYTSGRVSSITDFAGRVSALGYTSGKLTSYSEPDPDGAGAQSAPQTTFTYNSDNKIESYTNAETETTSFTYGASGVVTSHTDATSVTVDYEPVYLAGMVGAGLGTLLNPAPLVAVDDVSGTIDTPDLGTTIVKRDRFGNVLESIDDDGNVTSYVRDADGRVLTMTEPDPDGAGPLTAHVTSYSYDARGNVLEVEHPDSSTESWTYHWTYDKPLTHVDANGHETIYTYDSAGNLLAERKVIGLVDGVGNSETDDVITSYTYTDAPVLSTDPPKGLVASMTDALGRVTEYEYNESGLRTKVTYAVGTADEAFVEYTYDAADRLFESIDELGRVTTYAYDALDRLSTMTLADPDGAGPLASPVFSYEYDGVGRPKKEIDPLGRETLYTYNDRGELTKVERPDHDSDSQLTTTQYGYNDAGLQTTVTDPLGRVTTSAYNTLGQLVSQTLPDPDGVGSLTAPVTSYTYDDLGRTLTVTDALNNVTSYAYANFGRTVTVTQPDPDGAGSQTAPVTEMIYDALGQLVSTEDALGRITTYEYDELGRQIQVTAPDPDGAGPLASPVTGYEYDKVGNLRFVTDPLGNVTEYQYDARNRLVKTILPDPDGVGSLAAPEIESAYDDAGQLVSSTDALDRITTYEYDDLGRLVLMTLPDPDGAGSLTAPETAYAYDAAGRKTSMTDALGNVTTYEYDLLDHLVEVTSPDPDGVGSQTSPVTAWEYDAAGQLLNSTDALGSVTSYEYDALGRTTKATMPDPDGVGVQLAPWTVYTYDAVGNTLTSTDRLGHATTYAYDNLYRQTSITNANSEVTTYTYDLVGNLLTLTDPENNTTTWAFDDLNRVTTETNELSASRTFEYDAASNLTEKTDRLGRVTEYGYDDLHRRTTEVWKTGGSTVRTLSWEYDAANQLVSASDPSAAYDYVYDQLGRTTSITGDIAGLTPDVVLSQAFDRAGNRTQLAAEVGGTDDFVNDYVYDNLYRLTRITQQSQSGGNAVAEKRFDLAYNALGQQSLLTRYADAAGTEMVATTTYGYDLAHRLTSLAHTQGVTDLAGYDYVYDAANRIASIDSLVDGLSQYNHDDTNQLTDADHTGQTDESYTYDDNGNRIMSGYVVGSNNRITSDGTYNYEYDAEGNMTAKETIATGEREEYAWDHRNRLVSVTFKDALGAAVKQVDQTYDLFNRWVRSTVDPDGAGVATATDRFFVYDGNQIVLEFDGAAASDLVDRYVWSNQTDQLLSVEQVTSLGSAGTVVYALTDHLGTTRDLLTYNTGTNVSTIASHRFFDSFGNLISETNSSVTILIGFTGRPFDTASGKQWNLNRWYVSRLGVWMSEDPIQFAADDSNLRRYVSNSPLMNRDTTGMNSELLQGADNFAVGTKGIVVTEATAGIRITVGTLVGTEVMDYKGIVDSVIKHVTKVPVKKEDFVKILLKQLTNLTDVGKDIAKAFKSKLPDAKYGKLIITSITVEVFAEVTGSKYEVADTKEVLFGYKEKCPRYWKDAGVYNGQILLAHQHKDFMTRGGFLLVNRDDAQAFAQSFKDIFRDLNKSLPNVDAKKTIYRKLAPTYKEVEFSW